MNDSRLPTILYFLLLAFGIAGSIHVYPQLPAVMASHFTAYGQPNGWAPKPAFFLIMTIAVVVTTIPTFIVPRKISSLSAEKINLPNKEYWLSPEHREGTWSFLRVQMAWFGCALLFILLYATSQAINANLPSIRHFNWRGMLYVLVGFSGFCILWLVHFLRHFYTVPESEISSPTR